MIFCLFNLHLVSYGFGVGEAWNGGEKGEEGSQQKNPCNLRHGGSVGLLWMSVYPGSMDETYHTGASCSTPFQTRVRLSPFH